MALFYVIKQSHQSKTSYKFMISHIGEKLFYGQEPVYQVAYIPNNMDPDQTADCQV